MISEKGLCRCMKEAYKFQGYTVIDHGDALSLYCSRWYVRISKSIIPRKVLGLLVEHMGVMTADGDALLVRSGEDVQLVLAEEVGGAVAQWTAYGQEMPIAMTAVSYGGLRLFQQVQGGNSCFVLQSADIGLVDRTTLLNESGTLMIGQNRVLWNYPGEFVALPCLDVNGFEPESREHGVLLVLGRVNLLRADGVMG